MAEKEMVKLKPITEKNWIVLNASETKIGVLFEVNLKFTLLSNGIKRIFNNKDEVNLFFNGDVFSNIIKEEKNDSPKIKSIKSYPVDFDNAIEIQIQGVDLPLYKKKADSEVIFSAGYYCLKYPKGWMDAYCPKKTTLDSYIYHGPFTTELEQNSILQKLRKESK